MGLNDYVNYVIFDNPLSQSVISTTKHILQPLDWRSPMSTQQTVKIITERLPLWQLANNAGPFIRLGGFSGALAVALGAYGAHKKYPKDKIDELKVIYEKGNQYHMYHSLALLSVPLTANPKLMDFYWRMKNERLMARWQRIMKSKQVLKQILFTQKQKMKPDPAAFNQLLTTITLELYGEKKIGLDEDAKSFKGSEIFGGSFMDLETQFAFFNYFLDKKLLQKNSRRVKYLEDSKGSE